MKMKMNHLIRKLSLSGVLLVLFATSSFAQDDYHKFEVYGGYSYSRVSSNTKAQNVVITGDGTLNITDMCSSAFTDDLGPNLQKQFYCSRRGFNGFYGSATYNFTKYLGVQGDFMGSYKKDQIIDTGGGATTTVNTSERLYSFLGGIQIKNNVMAARVKPFAHVLAGAAHYSATINQTVQPFTAFNFQDHDSVTSFAMKLGGGIDVRAGRRIDIRVIEVDYNPIFARDRALQTISGPFTVSSTGKTTHNFSIGFGLAFH